MINSCPHCGSDEGIHSTYNEKREGSFNWEGNLIESDNMIEAIFNRKTGVCVSCDKRVKMPIWR